VVTKNDRVMVLSGRMESDDVGFLLLGRSEILFMAYVRDQIWRGDMTPAHDVRTILDWWYPAFTDANLEED
jgi:hypothetical protein